MHPLKNMNNVFQLIKWSWGWTARRRRKDGLCAMNCVRHKELNFITTFILYIHFGFHRKYYGCNGGGGNGNVFWLLLGAKALHRIFNHRPWTHKSDGFLLLSANVSIWKFGYIVNKCSSLMLSWLLFQLLLQRSFEMQRGKRRMIILSVFFDSSQVAISNWWKKKY